MKYAELDRIAEANKIAEKEDDIQAVRNIAVSLKHAIETINESYGYDMTDEIIEYLTEKLK